MSRRALRTALACSSMIAFSAAMACGSSKEESTASAGQVVLFDSVKLFDAKKADDVVVLPGQLEMPKSTHDAPKAGDVLVGEAGESASSPNKWGFLRRVTAVTEVGGKYVVTTEQAELADVVKEGEFQTTLEMPSIAPEDGVAEPTSAFKGGGKTYKILDFSGKSLFKNTGAVDIATGKSIGYDASVVLSKGTLDFTPTWDVGAKFGGLSGFSLKGLVKEAHVVAVGSLNATAEVTASLKLTSTATGEDVAALIAKKIFNKPSATIADHKIKLPSIKFGPLSMPAHVEFKAIVECDMKWGGETTVVAGGKANLTVKGGAKYDGSTITPIWEHSESLEQIGPTWTITNDIGLRCAIKPQMRLNLYDVASGEIMAEAYAAVNAKARCDASKLTGTVEGNAYAGAKAKAHAKLDVFGLYKWEKECVLFDVMTPVASVSGSFPLGKGATCTPFADEPLPTPVKEPGPSCFGTTSTGDAGTDSGPVLCDHDVCTNGTPLTTGCTQDTQGGACIKAICENDPYCCTIAWSASCIDKVEKGMYGCTARKCTTP